MNHVNFEPRAPRGWIARLGLAVLFILGVVAAIALSAVLFGVFLVLALIGSAWFWWQTRHLRKTLREQNPDIIEGEYQVLEIRPSSARADKHSGDEPDPRSVQTNHDLPPNRPESRDCTGRRNGAGRPPL